MGDGVLTVGGALPWLCARLACGPSLTWLGTLNPEVPFVDAWGSCSRGTWLAWLVERCLRAPERRALVGVAAARTAFSHLTRTVHSCVRMDLEALEGWALGDLTAADRVGASARLSSALFVAELACSARGAGDREFASASAVRASHLAAVDWPEKAAIAAARAAELACGDDEARAPAARAEREAEIARAIRAVVPFEWLDMSSAEACR